MGTPQVIYLVLIGLGLGISMARHGQAKKGTENFFIDFVAAALCMSILTWGGFFG